MKCPLEMMQPELAAGTMSRRELCLEPIGKIHTNPASQAVELHTNSASQAVEIRTNSASQAVEIRTNSAIQAVEILTNSASQAVENHQFDLVQRLDTIGSHEASYQIVGNQ